MGENLGRYFFYTERTPQRKDFELILTVKMEVRHPEDCQFGSEFLAICNHCGVMADCSRKIWKICKQFLRFLEKTTPTVFFKNFASKVFTVSPIDVVVFKCHIICPTENR